MITHVRATVHACDAVDEALQKQEQQLLEQSTARSLAEARVTALSAELQQRQEELSKLGVAHQALLASSEGTWWTAYESDGCALTGKGHAIWSVAKHLPSACGAFR